MAVANALAYYDMATVMAVKILIVHDQGQAVKEYLGVGVEPTRYR
jgi:hypothetical protein